jgi:hypothetical protein
MESHWIVFLVLLIPFWLLQNTIHELSHGLTRYFGWKWKFKIWPFPSWKLGRFTFAHVKYEKTEESEELTDQDKALVSVMPKIVNSVFIIVATILSVAISNKVASIIFLLFAWCNFVDFCFGVCSVIFRKSNESDMWKFQRYLNLPVELYKLISIGAIIYMALPIVLSTISFIAK